MVWSELSMQKLVLFLFLLVGVWYVRRQWSQPDNETPSSPPEAPSRSETMRECRYCGVLVPESEGLSADGGFFCSAEHVRAHVAACK